MKSVILINQLKQFTMKDSEKRDFVNQMIQLTNEEKDNLIAGGFTPDVKLTSLTEKKIASDKDEIKQQEAAAASKKATAQARKTLDEAYIEASDLADLISGVLGKNSEIVKRMRKFRK